MKKAGTASKKLKTRERKNKKLPARRQKPEHHKKIKRHFFLGGGKRHKEKAKKQKPAKKQHALKGRGLIFLKKIEKKHGKDVKTRKEKKHKKHEFFGGFGRRKKKAKQEPALKTRKKFLVREPVKLVIVQKPKDITKTDIKYPLLEPFAYAHIKWSEKEGKLRYLVIEPQLSENEREILKKIEEYIEEMIDVKLSEVENRGELINYLQKIIDQAITILNLKVEEKSYSRVMYFVYRNFVGMNEIEPLLHDPYIEDIGCVGTGIDVYLVHKVFGSLETNMKFDNEEYLENLVIKIAERCGRYVSYAQPLFDGSLPDGSRVQATLAKDVTTRGASFSIRKFRKNPFSPVDLIKLKTASPELMAYLWLLIQYSRNIMVCGGVATGKCISPKDYVQMADGEIIEAEKLYERAVKNRAPANLLTLSDNPLSIKKAMVNKFWRLNAKTLFNIKTRGGITISTTPEHEFLCMRGGQIKKIRADELGMGEWVASTRFLPIEGKTQPVNIFNYDTMLYAKDAHKIVRKLCRAVNKPYGQIAKQLNVKYNTLLFWMRENAIPLSKLRELASMAGYDIDEINKEIKTLSVKKSDRIIKNIFGTSPELAKIVGYILADGNIEDTYVNFHNSNKKMRDEFENLIKGVFGTGIITVYGKNRTPRAQVCSLAVVEILNKVFGIPKNMKKADIIEVPTLISKSSLNEVSGFLSALFDCESYVSDKECEIEFSTASEKLAKQLPYLLLRFGIVPRIKVKYVRGRKYYRIYLHGSENLNKFKEVIGYTHPEKTKKLNFILGKTKNYSTNVDLVPANKIIKTVCNRNNINNSQLARVSGMKRESIRDIIIEKVNPQRITLGKIVRGFEKLGIKDENVKVLNFLANSDIFWDKIESVKAGMNGKEFVYDVTVDGTHNFVAGNFGGLIISNTTFLNSMCMFLPEERKVVSIEDTRELNIEHENWIPAVTRIGFGLPEITGLKYGEVELFDLLKESFRQKPDYIIVGEVRGKEAYVLFQGMASGNPSLGTMHAGSVDDVVKRLETPPIELSPSLVESLDAVIIMSVAKERGESARRVKEIDEIISIDRKTGEPKTFRVFEWNPKNDSFRSNLRQSAVLKRVASERGLTAGKLFREIEARRKILERMQEKDIAQFQDVSKLINEYYKNPAGVLKILGK